LSSPLFMYYSVGGVKPSAEGARVEVRVGSGEEFSPSHRDD